MSLDFVILGDDGAPAETVALSVELHHELITAAERLLLDQVLRFKDYYQDVEFSTDGLAHLAGQLAVLRGAVSSGGMLAFLDKLEELLAKARLSGKGLHAVAD